MAKFVKLLGIIAVLHKYRTMRRHFIALAALSVSPLLSCSDSGENAATAEGEEVEVEGIVAFTPRPFDPAIIRSIENAKNPPRPKIDEAKAIDPDTPNLQVVNG